MLLSSSAAAAAAAASHPEILYIVNYKYFE